MNNPRHVRIFKNGSNQAVRIPREMELPTSDATIHKEGNRLVIEPVERPSLFELLASWEPLTDDFPQIVDVPPEPIEL